ncbi:MAG TPA: PAS domain S-box protein, partial [Verrucomicrobiae bacterium]|nr:PAS domain S-box protein [Verrucomicrobiae bacterium]
AKRAELLEPALMSYRIEDFVVLCVISILVALFAWIYLRDRQPKTGWWLLGWTAILLHFAAFSLTDGLIPGWQEIGKAINRATLVIAGTFFLLSVADVKTKQWKNAIGTVLLGFGGVVYAIARTTEIPPAWFYVGILVGFAIVAIGSITLNYGWRDWFWNSMCVALLPYYCFVIVRAMHGFTRDGFDFYLFALFATTGLLYLRHFRRPSPGVIFTAIAFLAWGCVFPLAAYLGYHGIRLSAVLWDLPKYSVAFGMLMTLFENQAEAATAAARQFQGLFENNLAAVYVSTLEGKLLDCNSAFLSMYGFRSKEDAIAADALSHRSTHGERTAFLRELKTQGHVLNYECRHQRRDGTPFWILERATIVADGSGRPVIEGTAIDITERKLAEIALKQSEERFATIFRQSPVGCVVISLDGVFLSVNENMLAMVGRKAEDVIGRTSVELGFFPDEQERRKFYELLRAKGSIRHMEVSFKDYFGNLHQGLYFANLVWIGDRECIFGMLLDQTEHRELERKFRQAQKMEALGRLAGGVAHDFNNLLGVIGGYAELLESKLSSEQNYRRYCNKILDTTERASALTRQLLTFSRKEIIRPIALRPDQVIRELNSILPRLMGEDVEIALELNSTGTLVMDKTHFEQIILNIVVNARDAMPSGGQLHITSEDVSQPQVSDFGSLAVNQAILIHIRDTGSGMSEETRAHAFEPFYTTKQVGRGTGLGLSTVYGIIQQSKGEITIESQLGKGTRVSILLPAILETEPLAAPEPAEEFQKGVGTILLVEDEPELLNANAEFLTSIGYSVICAGSGPEGLDLADKAGDIDLVISDVVMPKMNGREFADKLLRRRPDTKFLFVSGYADDVILRTGISVQGTPFLQKPFSLRQLGNMVNELLTVQKLS